MHLEEGKGTCSRMRLKFPQQILLTKHDFIHFGGLENSPSLRALWWEESMQIPGDISRSGMKAQCLV